MHLFDPSYFFYGGDAIVGGHLPNAVGCAYARKYQGQNNAVMAIFGDGATNGGAFFESLNIASAQKLPLIFLCENNGYAIGTKIERVSPFKKQAHKAKAYMPTIEVDGMDPLAVYRSVKKALEYVSDDLGPIFIEAMTCRFEGHSMSDSNSYRSSQEMKICKSQDPIEKIKNMIDPKIANELEKKAQEVINEAVEFAKNSPSPDISDLKKHTFTQEIKDVIS